MTILARVTQATRLEPFDVICENVPNGGTNSTGSHQTPRGISGVWSGITIYVAHEHIQRTFFCRNLTHGQRQTYIPPTFGCGAIKISNINVADIFYHITCGPEVPKHSALYSNYEDLVI